MKPENLPFFGEDVVNLHLVVTQQFACIGVKNLQRQTFQSCDQMRNKQRWRQSHIGH